MAENVETYLRELQEALAGADPALIQDALFDAEEHLQAEMAALEPQNAVTEDQRQIRFNQVVEAYGSPEEVAAAYLTVPAEATSHGGALGGHPSGGAARNAAAPSPTAAQGLSAAQDASQSSAWLRFFGVVTDPRVYKTLLYMIVSLGTGIAFFTVVVTGLSLSAGLMILIIGLPFLLLFLGVVRGLSFLEGRLVEVLLGTRMPRRPRSEPQRAGIVERMWFWLKDGRTWLAMVYMVLQLPLGVAYFTIAVTGLAVALWMIAIPFVQLGLEHTYLTVNTSEYLFAVWSLPLLVIGGALLLVCWLHVIRWIGRGHAAYAKAMLVRLNK